jgi:hypothetical protein
MKKGEETTVSDGVPYSVTSDDVTVVYGTTQRHLVNTSRELGVRGIFYFHPIVMRLTLIRMRDADYGESALHYNEPLVFASSSVSNARGAL